MQSLDSSGRFIEVSPNWCTVLGYARDEVIGQKFESFILPEELPLFQKNFKRFRETGFICDANFHMVCKDGHSIEVSYDGKIYTDPATGEIQTFCVFNDLTLARQAEIKSKQALLESENRYHEVQENMNIGVFRVTLEGDIIYCNSALVKLFGMESALDLIGTNSRELFADAEDREQILNRLINSEEDSVISEKQLVRKDGSVFWGRLHIKVIKDANGDYLYRDGTIEDVSDQKLLEKSLMEAKEKAQMADRLKSTFLANMSHEIRTPMNAILGFSELLLDTGIPNAQKVEFSSLIINNGNILMNLIDDIIDISKIEAEETKITMAPYRISLVLQDLYVQFTQRIKKSRRKLNLKLDIDDSLKDKLVTCDRHRFRQVVSNMLDNALKFTSEGEISFGLLTQNFPDGNESILVYIEDTGIGIPEDKLKLIFEQFRQVDESPTRRFGGTGLGLYICQKLVALMGGKINVASKLGKGSRFEIVMKA